MSLRVLVVVTGDGISLGRAVEAVLRRRPAVAGALGFVSPDAQDTVLVGVGAIVAPADALISRHARARYLPTIDPHATRRQAEMAAISAAAAAMDWRLPGDPAERGTRPAEVFDGDDEAALAFLLEARTRIAGGARIILVGGISVEIVREALLKDSHDLTRTHVYVCAPEAYPDAADADTLFYLRAYGEAPDAAFWDMLVALETAADYCHLPPGVKSLAPLPARLLLCDAHGPSPLDLTAPAPRTQLARDAKNLIAARHLMLKSAGAVGDYGRQAQASWAERHAGKPASDVIRCDLDDHVRVYTPVAPAQAPLIYLHGGGMVYYNLDVFEPLMTQLAAATRREVYAFTYDSLPEASAEVSLNSLMARLAQYAPQAAGAAIAGDSVGGLLALYVATRVLPGRFGRLVMVYPVLSLTRMFPSYDRYGERHLLDSVSMRWFRALLTPFFVPRGFDPLCLTPESLSGMDVILISASCDVLADEAESFATKHPTIAYSCLGGAPHDFCLHVGKLATAQESLAKVVSALS